MTETRLMMRLTGRKVYTGVHRRWDDNAHAYAPPVTHTYTHAARITHEMSCFSCNNDNRVRAHCYNMFFFLLVNRESTDIQGVCVKRVHFTNRSIHACISQPTYQSAYQPTYQSVNQVCRCFQPCENGSVGPYHIMRNK